MSVTDPVKIQPAGIDEFQVWLKIGVQSFPVGVPMDKEGSLWYADQLTNALEVLINERITNQR